MRSFTVKNISALLLLTFGIMVCGSGMVKGQTFYQRVYSSSVVSIGDGTMTSINASADGNPLTSSTIDISASILSGAQSRYQEFSFTPEIPVTTPVNIKFSTQLPINLLSGATITLQAYNNSSKVGTTVSLASGILGLAGGNNMLDYVLPAPGGLGTYNKIRITIEVGGLAISAKLKVFEVYYNNTGSSVCESKPDYLFGVTGDLLGGANQVVAPEAAIDGNILTSANLKVTAAVAASVFETVLFNSLSKPGDLVNVVLKNGDGGLLDVTLISSNISISAFNGNTEVATLTSSSSLLQLNLLPGDPSIQVLSFPVTQSFDRIRIAVGGGVANLLQNLYIYEVSRKAPKPIPNAINLTGGSITRCLNEVVNFTIDAPESTSKYRWFNAQSGGTELLTGLNASGTSFSPTGLTVGTYDFYVSLARTGCISEYSDRAKISVKVLPLPEIALVQNLEACQETTSLSFSYSSTKGSPNTYSIIWAANTAGFNNIINASLPLTPNGFITIQKPVGKNVLPNITYTGTLTVSNGTCTSTGLPVSVKITAKPNNPNINIITNSQY